MMSIISFDVPAQPAVDHSLRSMLQTTMVDVPSLWSAPIVSLAAAFIAVSSPSLIHRVAGLDLMAILKVSGSEKTHDGPVT